MTISKREAQKHLWDFMSHLWEFLTKKSHSYPHSRMIYDHFQARSAKIFMGFYGSLMDIFDPKKVIHDKNNFCLIDGHF